MVNTVLVGFIFWLVIVFFNKNLALIFTSSSSVIQIVNDLAMLLAFTVLLNCIQPVLSGERVYNTNYSISTQLKFQFDIVAFCWYLLVFRGGSRIWSSSSGGIYKHWQLLLGRNTSGGSPGLVSSFEYCCKSTISYSAADMT